MTNDELAAKIGETTREIVKLQKRLCALLTAAAKRAKESGHISEPVQTLATEPKD